MRFYRYGFQGQEMDNEIKGEGNSLNYKYRMHDPRIGRFFAVDPLTAKYPHYTPYQFSGNKVIHAVELEGLEESEINNPYQNEPIERQQGLEQVKAFSNKPAAHSFERPQKMKPIYEMSVNVNGANISKSGIKTNYEYLNIGEHMEMDAYDEARSNGTMTSDLYKQRDWSRFDENVSWGFGPNASYSAKEAQSNWMYDVDEFVGNVKTLVYVEMMVVTEIATAGGATPILSVGRRAASKAANQALSRYTRSLIDDVVTDYTLKGAVGRAPAGGMRVGNKFYKGGQFTPAPVMNYGRSLGAYPEALPALNGFLRPAPVNLISAPNYIRIPGVVGGSGLIYNYYLNGGRYGTKN